MGGSGRQEGRAELAEPLKLLGGWQGWWWWLGVGSGAPREAP